MDYDDVDVDFDDDDDVDDGDNIHDHDRASEKMNIARVGRVTCITLNPDISQSLCFQFEH